MNRQTAVAATVIALATLQVGVPAPAGAATRSVTLVAGDARPAVDLVGARVRNGGTELRFVLWVSDLGDTGKFRFHWKRRAFEDYYNQTWVRVGRRDGGDVRTLIEYSDGRDAYPIECPGSLTRWQEARDRLLIVIPGDCDAAPYATTDFDAISGQAGHADQTPTLTVAQD